MTEVQWPVLVGALRHVERLRQTESGLLSFGLTTAPVGGIFIEQGLVCWVAARGRQRRLHDLLRMHSRATDGALERVYDRCRAEGRPLGEVLEHEGVLAPNELGRALRRHSVECLVELCGSSRETAWWRHGGRGYAPRFTFRPVDLLLETVELIFPEWHAKAREELARVAGPGRRAAAFWRDSASGTLLPLAEAGGYDVEQLLALGRHVESLPTACHELGAAPSFALSTTENGETSVLWWNHQLLFSVCCEDRASLAAVTALRLVAM